MSYEGHQINLSVQCHETTSKWLVLKQMETKVEKARTENRAPSKMAQV